MSTFSMRAGPKVADSFAGKPLASGENRTAHVEASSPRRPSEGPVRSDTTRAALDLSDAGRAYSNVIGGRGDHGTGRT